MPRFPLIVRDWSWVGRVAALAQGWRLAPEDIQMWLVFRVVLLLLAMPAVVRADQPAGPPDVHVGDRWTFQQRDGLTDDLQGEFTRRVVTVSPTEITVVQQIKGRTGQMVNYFSRDWNLEDNGATKYEPSTMSLHMPMKIGDAWQGQYKSRALANGFTSVCHVSAKVVAHETIKVLAGTFDTLKVDGHLECRGAAAGADPVLIANSNWYAPAAKGIVKTTSSVMFEGRERSRSVTEMLSFSLADRAEPAPGEIPRGQAPSGQGSTAPSATPSAAPEHGI
jgi:hypothetical protein